MLTEHAVGACGRMMRCYLKSGTDNHDTNEQINAVLAQGETAKRTSAACDTLDIIRRALLGVNAV
jgi:hypothetical protein